jgi:very-short-patch-repair endonuclease
LDPAEVSDRRGIPCAEPLRTLVDIAAVIAGPELDDTIDRALASKLVTVSGIEAEVTRLSRRGRNGVGVIRKALERRGLIGAPNPSVLESKLLRLLHRAGIEPIGVEVCIDPYGWYRIDVMITPTLIVEVDGFAHHQSPEQKGEDERRRNRLRLDGAFLLVYTWRDVVFDGGRVVYEIVRALRRLPASA